MKELPCGWGRQGSIFPQLAVSGIGSIQWDDPVHSFIWGLWLPNERLWILGCATWEQSISHRRLTLAAAQEAGSCGSMCRCLLSPAQHSRFWGYFGRHTVSSIIWASWGQLNCNPDKVDTKNRLQDVNSVSPKPRVKLTCGRESVQNYHIPQPPWSTYNKQLWSQDSWIFFLISQP